MFHNKTLDLCNLSDDNLPFFPCRYVQALPLGQEGCKDHKKEKNSCQLPAMGSQPVHVGGGGGGVGFSSASIASPTASSRLSLPARTMHRSTSSF